MLERGGSREETCPLCGSAGSLCGLLEGRLFYACGKCDLVFVPSRFHLDRAREKAHYELHENSMENKGYVQMFTRKIRILRRVWRDVHRVLDYGCGPGPVLVELLRRIGYDATGFDPFFAPDTDLSAPFDAVVSTETFEHFRSPAGELPRLVGLLRPGGYLAVMTRWHPGARQTPRWWYARDPTHVAFYSGKTFQWIARRYDLEILYENGNDFVVYRRTIHARKL